MHQYAPAPRPGFEDKTVNWTILGIEETKDKKAITRAYRDRLMTVNPEEKPEEFKALRAAYEEALALADRQEETEDKGPKTPLDLWTDRLNAIYMNISDRLDPKCWQDLLSDDICQGIDTRILAEEAMMAYFYEHYKIPHTIWTYLDREFSFSERIPELYDKYSREFIDYVMIPGIEGEKGAPLELFAPGSDGQACDDYLNLLSRLTQTGFDEWGELYEQLRSMKVSHPYGEALLLRYESYKGDETALEKLKDLCSWYPEDIHLLIDLALLYRSLEMHREAIEICRKVAEMDLDQIYAQEIWAYSLADLGQYREAVKKLNVVMGLSGGNQKRLYELNEMRVEWNQYLLEGYKKAVEEDPQDWDSLFELCWCHIQRNEDKEAAALAGRLKKGFPDDFAYHNLMSILMTITEDYEASLFHIDATLKAIAALTDDSEDSIRRRKRVAEFRNRKARLLVAMKKDEEASAMLEEILQESGENADAVTEIAQTYESMKNYRRAAELSERVTKLLPGSYHGYLMLASNLFELREDAHAYDAINSALELDGSDLFAYILKFRILLRNDAVEQAKELMDFLDENGVGDDSTVQWCKALLIKAEENDDEKALKLYESIEAKMEEAPIRPLWKPEFYFNYALVLANVKDSRKDYSRKDLLELLEKGIAADETDFDCLEYKAWLLKKDDKIEESLKIYKELEKRPRNNLYIEDQLADAYYQRTYFYADKALEYLKLFEEERAELHGYHFSLAYCYYRMGKLKEAEAEYLKGMELDPENAYGCHRLGVLYLMDNQVDKALRWGEKAVEYALKGDRPYAYYWTSMIQALRRLERPEDAAKAVMERQQKACDYTDGMSELNDIFLQFGMWDAAEENIDHWKAVKPSAAQALGQLARLYIYKKEFKKALHTINRFGKDMNEEDRFMAEAILSAVDGNFEVLMDYRRTVLKQNLDAGHVDLYLEYCNLAMALWYCGRKSDAKIAAEEVLKQLRSAAAHFGVYKPLERASQAVALAILGNREAALSQIEKMRRGPLCESCAYGVCKDSYLYEAVVLAFCGDLEAAEKIVTYGFEAFPDEEGLILLDAYLNTMEK